VTGTTNFEFFDFVAFCGFLIGPIFQSMYGVLSAVRKTLRDNVCCWFNFDFSGSIKH
jgi:hypothetical protein